MRSHVQPRMLDNPTLVRGVRALCKIDPDFANIYQRLGTPPLWAREPGFPTLVYIILEQQVSLASAKAAFTKLQAASSTITPRTFLKFSDEELKRIGFSRQKAAYCRGLAQSVLKHALDLDTLATLEDDAVRSTLLNIKGIGPWTVNIYLLMVLLRPDIWPSGDLALAVAYQKLKRLDSRPTTKELESIAENWRPWRAVAARLLWFHYLNPER